MSTSIPIISLTPSNVATAIPVIVPCLLPPPFDVTAAFITSKSSLTAVATITVPVEIASSAISFYQYFNPAKTSDLQFYFVYDLEGPESGDTHDFICEFSALNVDSGSNPIDLSKIATIHTMVKDLDPKTSRGTVTTVRISSDGE